MKTFLFLLLASLLLAESYPSFTDNELRIIKKSNVIAKKRITDYQNKLQIFNNFDKDKQLNKVNLYLNKLLPQYDDVIHKQENNWATPKEFLTIGYGDCEDYAIIKYYSLIKLGFNEKKLFITLAKEKFRGGSHMVLTYFKTKNRPPLVLDNLSFKILDLKTRKDLQAGLFINSNGVYKIKEDFILQKVAKKYKEFEELQTKVNNNR